MVIADKVSRKKVDTLHKEYALKFQEISEQHESLMVETSKQSQLAMIKGMVGGTLLGSAIAIAASFII
jgi:hypothetical protein